MAFATRDERRAYDRKRYAKLKAKSRLLTEGRKIIFTTRLSETLLAVIQRLADNGHATGSNPWRSKGDVVRALLVRGLQEIRAEAKEQDEETINEFLPQIEMDESVIALDRERRSAEATFAGIKRNIDSLLNIDAKVTAQQCYTSSVEQARKLPRSIWAGWLIEELENAYPAMAKVQKKGTTPGIPLTAKWPLPRQLR